MSGTRALLACVAAALLAGCGPVEHSDIAPAVSVDVDALPLRILFVGDTSFGENYQASIAAAGGVNILEARGYPHSLQKLDGFLQSADVVVANLETPVTGLRESPLGPHKKYIHWSDVVQTPQTLRANGIRTVSLANNHTLDFGMPGLLDTMDALDRHDIIWFGAGPDAATAARPLLLRSRASTAAPSVLIAAGFEFRKYYDEQLQFYARGSRGGANVWTARNAAAQIGEMRRRHPRSFIVAFPHWGKNYVWKLPRQTDMARAMIDAGADLVIGHGAHMLQEIEEYRGRWVIHSLGNFVFNAAGRYRETGTDPYSLVAKLLVEHDGSDSRHTLRLYPIVTDNLATAYQSRPVSGPEFEHTRRLLLEHATDPGRLSRQLAYGRDDTGHFLELDVTPLRGMARVLDTLLSRD